MLNVLHEMTRHYLNAQIPREHAAFARNKGTYEKNIERAAADGEVQKIWCVFGKVFIGL